MKLLHTQIDESSLIAFGEEARSLVLSHDYASLARKFGYALAYDRPPATAIEADYLSAIASPITAESDMYFPSTITVKFFSPNTTGLFAVVECPVPVDDKVAVLLELIVAGKGEEKHITVEDISGVAT
ncbi:hypothetical protein [Parvibium lacunae]|uniref:Uncharacterized protein n=1 Tax=Parvibium lacunae TaxID=1888893 RepID=A0A368L6W9_9BURK|nr:hypothetical protein [Parvibium lacunae]RCS59393.1 hypothetical protein DU000_01270 [Parvibium lacunae]